ncbi:MAG: ABC transporter permease [Actinobacteria bacterium]|nr:ABC transporter permease [Actinomycetota bacterium]
MFWKRLFRVKSSVLALVILLVILFSAIFAPLLAPFDPIDQNLALRREVPSKECPLGRDPFGRDILSRILYGGRLTILVAMIGASISTFFGTLLGVYAAYYGGKVSTIIMRSVDVILSFPYFLLAILIVAVTGPGLDKAVIATAIAAIPRATRIIRGAALSIVNSEYIESAKAIGASNLRIITHHILNNVTATIIVFFTLQLSQVILSVAALSFLGLGAQPPMPEWGLMLNESKGYLMIAPHMSLIPGVFIMLFVLAANLLGDGLRDVLDPKLR